MKKHKKKINKTEKIQPLTTGEPHQETIKVADISHDKLLEALFFFWDGFERASMNFFSVKDTARQIKADQPLEGNSLTLGIRRMEWQGGQDRVFQAFIEHERIEHEDFEHGIKYTYKGIPVYLYIYDDNPCITTLDIVFYNNDTFNMPTPFDTFCEKYDYV